MIRPNFIVRKDDGMVFIENKDGLYHTMDGDTFICHKKEDLLADELFEECPEEDLPKWEDHKKKYYEFVSWQSRSDGHGGIKGGTYEEFLKRKK